jgi:glucokinase
MPSFSIGVDLGGTNLRIAAVSPEGELLEKISVASNLSLGPDQVIAQMCDDIQHLCAKYRDAAKFLGVGVGVPGIVDVDAGVMQKAANLPGWEDYPARAEIEQRLRGCAVFEKKEPRVILENDARAAGLGEQWIGAARGVANVAMLTLGTGIGGCIILNGKIWRGRNGLAGEFGHLTVEPDGIPCGCGNRGCSERYASASALVRMAREAIAGGAAPALAQAAASQPEFGAKEICQLALQGDEPSRRIFSSFGRYLGILLADLVNILNFEIFVIGGGVASAWEAFSPKMLAELATRSIVYATAAHHPGLPKEERERGAGEGKTVITRAVLGGDAGLYGAARLGQITG